MPIYKSMKINTLTSKKILNCPLLIQQVYALEQDFKDLMDWQDRLFGFSKMRLVVRLPILSFTSQFAPHTSHFLYSVLKDFTGLTNAAFID
jgi:hypothetical protein